MVSRVQGFTAGWGKLYHILLTLLEVLARKCGCGLALYHLQLITERLSPCGEDTAGEPQ